MLTSPGLPYHAHDFFRWLGQPYLRLYGRSAPTTTLMVDVLSLEGAPVLADIASGTDLSGLDPAQYRALRLRVRLASGAVGETPALDR